MGKLGLKYLIITFSIMIVTWGTCLICSLNGIFFNDNPILYVPAMLGGWSPTIASYFALKSDGDIKGGQGMAKCCV